MAKYMYASNEAEKITEVEGFAVSILPLCKNTISHTVYNSTCCSRSSNCWV